MDTATNMIAHNTGMRFFSLCMITSRQIPKQELHSAHRQSNPGLSAVFRYYTQSFGTKNFSYNSASGVPFSGCQS